MAVKGLIYLHGANKTLTLWTPGAGLPTLRKLPYGARSLLTDGTVYQRHCQESVDRRHGI